MPTYLTKTDADGNQTREPAERAEVQFAEILPVASIALAHSVAVLYDADGREAIIITRGSYPGAGLSVEIAEHVKTTS